jgi:hypothetical protein
MLKIIGDPIRMEITSMEKDKKDKVIINKYLKV